MTVTDPAAAAAAAAATQDNLFVAVFKGIAQWFGEAVIGLIPLAIIEGVHRFSTLPITATCPDQKPNPISQAVVNCKLLPESSLQEVCVLAVVISGLAILSIAPLSHKKPRKITVWTVFLLVAALVALIFGALFFGLISAHLERDISSVTYYTLYVALLSSFFLAVEGAILNS